MHYDEVEQAVRELATAADDEKRHRFGAETVVRLTAGDDLADAAGAEFDDDAGRRSSRRARTRPAALPTVFGRGWTRSTGARCPTDMDPQVLWALEALEHWASFLADRDPEAVVQLAIRSLEAVDYEVPARLDDFLASPAMAAEFDRIGARLGSRSAARLSDGPVG
ncbi:hypothetical protein [Lentzea flaviverrucosa]|uniref:Uncharacterized protein n=1 Tax=Lentzea flaviverrucosa TaxID=200379 RepID=A0A1H9C2W4_9PSEU|nr:hypothetical protein [Lentzea flaviverrucosa]RDI24432.1 hypothetical protein DFR72_10912 [Lentzea flaviverrucosa]SEP95307.1 hypothetical protein SAMN05216195_101667 [Lentzea flaviverrucosa]